MYVVIAGLVVRATLFALFPGLPQALDARVECTTAVSSWKRFQEGLYQYQHGGSPYSGGIFHQSPLLLGFFASIADTVPSQYWYLAVNCVYTIADVAAALALVRIARAKVNDTKFPSLSPAIVAAVYLFNPFTLLSTVARSTLTFTNSLITMAAAACVGGRPAQAMTVLALASCLSLYPMLLAPAFVSLGLENANGKGVSEKIVRLVMVFVVSVSLLVGWSYYIAQTWEFLESTYGIIVHFSELTPNIGLWWYYFIEMFDFFRPFFTYLFHIYVAAFSVPVAIRFSSYPLFALCTIVGICSTFKSYPETSDIGIYFSLLTLCKPVFSLVRYPLPVALVVLYTSVLAPTFYHLWIDLGSGNSNFFYAITLVYALGMILLLADSIWAVLRLEYDGGKDSSVVQI
uniref:ARAD1C36124p n=1 Tax=Blastobotrys adeninivorans TaxID=409370 RepID=A0A060T3S9_BLAAD